MWKPVWYYVVSRFPARLRGEGGGGGYILRVCVTFDVCVEFCVVLVSERARRNQHLFLTAVSKVGMS